MRGQTDCCFHFFSVITITIEELKWKRRWFGYARRPVKLAVASYTESHVATGIVISSAIQVINKAMLYITLHSMVDYSKLCASRKRSSALLRLRAGAHSYYYSKYKKEEVICSYGRDNWFDPNSVVALVVKPYRYSLHIANAGLARMYSGLAHSVTIMPLCGRGPSTRWAP